MFTILFSYNRRRELLRLLRWAQHNGLKHPYRLYHFRWQAEEVRLSRASVLIYAFLLASSIPSMAWFFHHPAIRVRAAPAVIVTVETQPENFGEYFSG
jgi:hypothetical protein